jgi:hypothetical protein
VGERVDSSWATELKVHGRQSSKFMGDRVQSSWATELKVHGRQSSKFMGDRVQNSWATEFKIHDVACHARQHHKTRGTTSKKEMDDEIERISK